MNVEDLKSELIFKSVRSGGKGGQNVNKVSTKVELYFDILNSKFLDENEKSKVLSRLKNRIDSEGILKISSQSERSQILNKNLAVKKFIELINESLKEKKKRIKTNPTLSSKTSKLKSKKIISEKKKIRSMKIDFDE